jgi:hypothetical protein
MYTNNIEGKWCTIELAPFLASCMHCLQITNYLHGSVNACIARHFFDFLARRLTQITTVQDVACLLVQYFEFETRKNGRWQAMMIDGCTETKRSDGGISL